MNSAKLGMVAAAAAGVLVALTPVSAQVLIDCGTPMRYLANSSNPGIGTTWTGFDDPGWAAGIYGVGYGAGGILRTTVPSGTLSVYTRATFEIPGDPQETVDRLDLGVDYDDGYVAWINGVEVARADEMIGRDASLWDAGSGSHESSNSASCRRGGHQPQVEVNITDVAKPLLVSGMNVLAIGVWNVSSGSTDLALIPRLALNILPTAARGPYLQSGTDTSIVVRWRTTLSTNSRVLYGPAPDALIFATQDLTETAEHIIPLSGLEPETTYFYSIGSTTEQLAGGDTDHFFITNPVPGTIKPFRVWVLGDSGTANSNARAVRDAYYAFTGPRHTDLWLMLGDNAYDDGTDHQYQRAVFEMYPEMLRKSVLWPTFGNHDARSADSSDQSGVYYDIFTLPRAAEAGGFASGTEAYYSFDFANVHFICLDSQETDRSPDGAMMMWLEEDVGDTLQDWVVAFWHHPPYSKGSHNSDGAGQLIQMREFALPILEAGGVDLVLSGHSHSYERSMLIDAHYGLSDTLTGAMILDDGDGRPAGDGAYRKPTGGLGPREGAVYTVAGSSGRVGGGSMDHPVMRVSLSVLGSVVLDFDDLRLDATFLDSTGVVRDTFTIVKGDCNAGGVPGKCDPADFDRDGDVDLGDQLIFDAGFSGPDEPTPDPRTDLDGDGDTDLADLLIFQAAFTGAQ